LATAKVELLASARESSATGRESSTAREPAAAAAETSTAESTLAAHHAEEDLRVDATHAATHATEIGWIHEIVTIVIGSAFPI
jgi:hypothetical protein